MLARVFLNWQLAIVLPTLTYVLFLIGGRVLAKRREKPMGIAFHLFSALVAFRLGAPVYFSDLAAQQMTFWWKGLESIAILTGAIVIVQFITYILYDIYLPSRQKVKVPHLLHDITTAIILVGALSVILKTEFNLSLPTILTTSTILAAIIGLALQELLSNLISGMTLQVEKPFKAGDWVSIDGQDGEVIGMSWRATRILTMEGSTVVIPNGTISKGRIINYDYPTRAHAQLVTVGIDYGASPNHVKACLSGAADQAAGVLRIPAPQARVTQFGESAITYELKYWIDNHALHRLIRDRVLTAFWYALRRENISVPYPIRTVQYQRSSPGAALASKRQEQASDVLSKVNLFASLPPDQLARLSEKAGLLVYGDGETVVREGESGQSLYVIKEGHADVEILVDGVAHKMDVFFGPGNHFGEMSLLTGEPRSATIRARGDLELLCIEKADIAPILESHPALFKELSIVLAQRKQGNEGYIKAQASTGGEEEAERAFSEKILSSMRRFFGIG